MIRYITVIVSTIYKNIMNIINSDNTSFLNCLLIYIVPLDSHSLVWHLHICFSLLSLKSTEILFSDLLSSASTDSHLTPIISLILENLNFRQEMIPPFSLWQQTSHYTIIHNPSLTRLPGKKLPSRQEVAFRLKHQMSALQLSQDIGPMLLKWTSTQPHLTCNHLHS